MEKKFYELPQLSFGYGELKPHMSGEQLIIHHQKHHQAYVTAANALLEKMDDSRRINSDFDQKSVLKELSFNISGHMLHSFFWKSLAPQAKGGGREPEGKLLQAIAGEFGSFERFKKEFTQAALSVEGSGWAALALCRETSRPLIMQIEKHNVNLIPSLKILLVLDVFEHAYYLDYKNERSKYIQAFWNIVSWQEAARKFEDFLNRK